MSFTDSQDRLLALLDKIEPRLKRKFLEVVDNMQRRLSLDEIVAALESGQILTLFEDVVVSEFGNFSTDVTAAAVVAGEDTAEFLSSTFRTLVTFDTMDPIFTNQMRENQLRLVREFSEEQRRATSDALVEGVRRGLNPRDQARNFRNSIGLTSRQLAAVNNFRRLLEEGSSEVFQRNLRDRRFDSTVRRAQQTDTDLTQAQIDRMVQRYQEKYLTYRSEVIARTEALSSVHQGTEESFRQGAERGLYALEELERKWNDADDPRVRASHARLDGMVRGFGETFPGDDGELRFPGDPLAPASETAQCRCVLSTRLP